jgi:hypothetical protein
MRPKSAEGKIIQVYEQLTEQILRRYGRGLSDGDFKGGRAQEEIGHIGACVHLREVSIDYRVTL